MNDLKAIAKDIDLYGSDVMLTALKQQYKTVAYTRKSIPTQGSPCRSSANIAANLAISQVVFHRNNEVTIFTNNGNLRFF